ncbi:hypothetical protein PR08_gp11 [Idiomarinaceae phage Phi1M2-2]|uniref:hypothetical protein n=1 Tax=Idiomarinaceae phage Phi1M2-2 TaxID=1527515 RepID=UPI0004F92FD5|nr:hypothetical protein PR08_gp11 [Idiomarinaceae phage Phi1M2-2]AIM40769.1 hypothetical protein M22_011 [Idiomarinaceae phage Phi1M2-2]
MVDYTTDRNKPLDADEPTTEAAILVANEVLQAFYSLDESKIEANGALWERVQAEATLLQLEGRLTLGDGIVTGEVASEGDSVGSLSTSRTYAEGTTAWSKPRTPYLDALIRPLLRMSGGMGFVVRV